MKKLKLTPEIKEKLDRLPVKVKDLSYLGADIDSYRGTPLVAIVGTRKPTPYGKQIVIELAEGLAKAGVTIVSGLALGVDSLAHETVVKTGGRAIAVLPSGLENIYPATHRKLAENIVNQHGTLISEYPAKHKPMKIEFLERNRIIAALSDAVIIPEAALNSGSLNTAGHALGINIPILVIPGNINSPMSAGTNQLLVDGEARAIVDHKDVMKALGLDSTSKQQKLAPEGGNEAETRILTAIYEGENNAETIQKNTNLDTVDFQTNLTMLEIKGSITINSQGDIHLK